METVFAVAALVWAVFSIVVMLYVLVAAKEAITYFQRENKEAWRASLDRNKIPR